MNKKTAIQSEQLRQLISRSNVSLVSSALLAAILAYMQREAIASAVVLAWFSITVAIVLVRAAFVLATLRSVAADAATVHVRMTRFRLGVVAAGMVWGSAGILLFPANDAQHQMFLIFMLAGLTAGGVVSFSADLVSAIAFSVLVTAPLTIRLFVAGGSLSVAMGMAAMLYLGFMIMSLRYINQNISENIALRLEADAREATLRASESRYRLLLSHSPIGVFHYDVNLIVTYCNKFFANMMGNSAERLIGMDMNNIKDKAVLSALRKALEGETDFYEGQYQAMLSDASIWGALTCAPFRNESGETNGGIGIVQDFTERKAAEEKILNLAFYDPVTGLPNRRLLLDRLQQAMASSARSGKEGALLFIDLDNFKVLNDTLGHDMGDLLLQQTAQRLVSCVREGDTVARLGGDEFVVMLKDLSEHALETAAQTKIAGEKILAALSKPYQFAAHEYCSTSSIGATLFGGHRKSKDELLKQADISMYQAKKAGRNTLRFFDEQMQNAITARAALEGDLRKALECRQFQLHYQIQVDDLRRPLGAEALIRWTHPERGFVSPAQFIPLAEETGLILSIGHWVLETACAQIEAWQQDSLTSGLVLAVNVSAKQFRQAD
ncbi:MAG: diguanylate cyclase, partial [Gallionella sp.]